MSPEIELEHPEIDDLEKTLENKNSGVLEKEKAAEKLGELGSSKSIKILKNVIEKSNSQKIVSAAARALGKINSLEVADFLHEKMLRRGMSPEKKTVISGALRHHFSDPISVREKSDSLDNAKDTEKKIEIMKELKELQAPESAEKVIKYLRSDKEELREKSEDIIRSLGHKSIVPLKKAAEKGDKRALEVLNDLGPELGYEVKRKKEKKSFLEKIFK